MRRVYRVTFAMGFANTASGRARKAMRLALNEVGRYVVAYIRESINTPIEFVYGPRGGISDIIRSDEGEAPRREIPPFPNAGKLWKSIKYKVGAGASGPEALEVDSVDCEYAPILEYVLNRPFMHPGYREMRRFLRAEFKRIFAEKLAYVNLDQRSNVDFPSQDVASIE